jgi:hypothetical protein
MRAGERGFFLADSLLNTPLADGCIEARLLFEPLQSGSGISLRVDSVD